MEKVKKVLLLVLFNLVIAFGIFELTKETLFAEPNPCQWHNDCIYVCQTCGSAGFNWCYCNKIPFSGLYDCKTKNPCGS
ncbi:MAG: hypothetical protein MUC72_06545 [Acidobacteria bacterium]|jgi:hypothetical protein|nr:hypothetical protein [Acidobacteriota bacterium]